MNDHHDFGPAPRYAPPSGASPFAPPEPVSPARVVAWIAAFAVAAVAVVIAVADRLDGASLGAPTLGPSATAATGDPCDVIDMRDHATLNRCINDAFAAVSLTTPSTTSTTSTGAPVPPGLAAVPERASLDLDQLAQWAEERAREQWRFGEVLIANVAVNSADGVVEIAISPRYHDRVEAVHAAFDSDPRIVVRLVRTPI